MTATPTRVAQLPDSMAPPVGHYSHAIVSGNQLFVSGLLALDEARALVGAGDAGAQAAFIFAMLKRILAAEAAGLNHVIKLNLYLLDLADRAAVNDARRAAFGDWRPASTLVKVAGLIGEGTLLEVEAVAAITPSLDKE